MFSTEPDRNGTGGWRGLVWGVLPGAGDREAFDGFPCAFVHGAVAAKGDGDTFDDMSNLSV